MVIISSHTLNGNDGTHAAGVAVTLANLRTRETLFYTATDETGRLAEAVEPPGLPTDTYELTLQTGQVLESPRSVI